MKTGLLILLLNLVLLLLYFNSFDETIIFRALGIGLIFLSIPFLTGLLFKIVRKTFFWSAHIVTGSIILVFLILINYTRYKEADIETAVHYDYRESIPEQKIAEEKVQHYIRNNSLYPSTYVSLKFGNLSKFKSYTIPNDISEEEITSSISNGDLSFLEKIQDVKYEVEVANPIYGFRHGYELMDRKGKTKKYIAHVQLDSALNVIDITNVVDFGRMEWKEKFGKKE